MSEFKKEHLEKAVSVTSQLQEMHHYAKDNMKDLSEFFLWLDDEVKNKELAEKMNTLLGIQDDFYKEIQIVIPELKKAYEDLEEAA